MKEYRTYKGLLSNKNLPDNGVFVFGSNKIGLNGNPSRGTGGAALVAQLQFGVRQGEIMNNCLSMSGKAYGIVTVDAPRKFISLGKITNNISTFYKYASDNVDKLFFVAYDGVNPNAVSLNGKTRLQLSKCFYNAGVIPYNVIFEENFYKLVFSFQK